MKKYLEKYALGMFTILIIIVGLELPNTPIPDMTWKHVVAGIIILPSFLYFYWRVNDNNSDVDAPYFTWKKFWLILSFIIGMVFSFIAAILLGLIQ